MRELESRSLGMMNVLSCTRFDMAVSVLAIKLGMRYGRKATTASQLYPTNHVNPDHSRPGSLARQQTMLGAEVALKAKRSG